MNNLKNILLLIVRLVAGGFLTYHLYTKFTNIDGVMGFFQGKLGLSSTIFWLVVVGETVATIGLILGLCTRGAALISTIIMIGAVYYTGGHESHSIYTLIASVITLLAGGGSYALSNCKHDAKVCTSTTTTAM